MDDFSQAELQVLHLLRGRDAKYFTLEIAADGDVWTVRLDDHDSGYTGTGQGGGFGSAWDDVTPARRRERKP
jgi:hypothetical protein